MRRASARLSACFSILISVTAVGTSASAAPNSSQPEPLVWQLFWRLLRLEISLPPAAGTLERLGLRAGLMVDPNGLAPDPPPAVGAAQAAPTEPAHDL